MEGRSSQQMSLRTGRSRSSREFNSPVVSHVSPFKAAHSLVGNVSVRDCTTECREKPTFPDGSERGVEERTTKSCSRNSTSAQKR
jgi:hypothetical protein